VIVAHAAIQRWVYKFTPFIETIFSSSSRYSLQSFMPCYKRISNAIGARTAGGARFFTLVKMKVIKNGVNCLQLTPFGCVVTPTGQISNHFMQDFKKLTCHM